MADNEQVEQPQESELLRIQREKYEKIIADKNKIIAELLNEPSKENKKDEAKDDEEDAEEKAKKDEEERKKKRAEFYKKHLY